MVKGKFPSSVKLDPQLKEDFDNWLWLNRETFSTKVEELIREFLKKHPLTKEEKILVDRHKKP